LNKEFSQVNWDAALERDLSELLRLAIREDLQDQGDRTSLAVVPRNATGRAALVARQAGVVAGLPAVPLVLSELDPRLRWLTDVDDGQLVQPGDRLGLVEGPVRSLLAAERLVLNLVGRLSGVATLTREYVEAVNGTGARVYDTRKTTPGWRRLEKYAVRCGGGKNHRTGLFDAVLIKDNHLAMGTDASSADTQFTPAEAICEAMHYLKRQDSPDTQQMIIEVEVDTLEQLKEVLPAGPDIVLLDNMTMDQLREAVACRDAFAPAVQLEASGGINLRTVRAVAETGVDRISVGALTHSAAWLDLGMDWLPAL
jgi:nicotinate-nucleotide pyrophosphorylase (carboxylating)